MVQQIRLKKTFLATHQDKAKPNVLEELGNRFNPHWLGDFDIRDVNFNGFEDLILADSDEGGYGSFTYSIYLYHPENQKFIKSKEFTEKLGQTNTGYLGMDRKAKKLSTAWKSGCCYRKEETWQLRNNKLVLVKEVIKADSNVLREKGLANDNEDINVTKTRK